MKESSIKEKAKRYDEALNRAKKELDTCGSQDCDAARQIFRLFPELKESKEAEDESIRKALINGFKDYKGWDEEWFDGITVREAIAWLEKQVGKKPVDKVEPKFRIGDTVIVKPMSCHGKVFKGKPFKIVDIIEDNYVSDDGKTYSISLQDGWELAEQKSDDKLESKFKVGDWIIFNGLTLYVKEVIKGFYRTISKGGITNSYDWSIDNVARLWTLNDVKNGDMLACPTDAGDGTVVFIFKQFINNMTDIDCFCCIGANGIFDPCLNDGYIGEVSCNDYYPATKEQRDTLEKAMADAGYTFDFENKELRKIVVPIFNIGDTIIKKHNSNIRDFGSFTITDIIGGKYWYNDRIICDITKQDEWEIYEQKPAWSEEDNKIIEEIINDIECARAINYHAPKEGYEFRENWLKSLKDRVQPKQKQEWGDVDRGILFRTIDNLKFLRDDISKDPKYAINIIDIEREITWLKSLSPQSQWKPSDEQMMALRWVLNHIPYDSHKEEISGLLEQLKKLREE